MREQDQICQVLYPLTAYIQPFEPGRPTVIRHIGHEHVCNNAVHENIKMNTNELGWSTISLFFSSGRKKQENFFVAQTGNVYSRRAQHAMAPCHSEIGL